MLLSSDHGHFSMVKSVYTISFRGLGLTHTQQGHASRRFDYRNEW